MTPRNTTTPLVQTYPPGRGSALTPEDREAIYELALIEHVSQSEIARRLGRTRETVALVLKSEEGQARKVTLVQELRQRTQDRLRASTDKAVNAWGASLKPAAAKGNHQPAKDLLLHTGMIDPVVADRAESGITIHIGIQLNQGKGTPGEVMTLPASPVSEAEE